MIAKRILTHKAAPDFKRLGNYLLRQSAGPTESQDGRVFDYILGEDKEAGRVGAVRVMNCLTDDPTIAIKKILRTQARNIRSRADPTYHLVVSFEPGEQPTREQIEDIEDELCKAIGLDRHERISATHIDQAHFHLHIAINKIHPVSFRCIEPYYDKRKLMAACEALELKHGLAKTNHGISARRGPKVSLPISRLTRPKRPFSHGSDRRSSQHLPRSPTNPAGRKSTPFSRERDLL